jgi:Domain of unknown function (DUF1996)
LLDGPRLRELDQEEDVRRTLRLATPLALLFAALAGLLGSAALAGSSKGRPTRAGGAVNFVSTCRFSHRAPDDPIVSPNRPGASHDHSFVGNNSTNAYSTLDSLRAASTTCQRPGDTAAYWMPTLLVGDKSVAPISATIYYRRRTMGRVQAFPAGLKMIAGNSHSTSAQDLRVTFWNCGVEAGIRPSSSVPTCPDTGRGSGLRLHVNFPSCWDGTNTDSPDHQSHMAYADRGACPSTHPVSVPAISLIYRYPSLGGPNVTLSSGGQYSAHADFFNAWNQQALNRLVESCLNAQRHCGRGF